MELSLTLLIFLTISIFVNIVLFFRLFKKSLENKHFSRESEQIDERFNEIKNENTLLKAENLKLKEYEGRFKELQEHSNRILIENEHIKNENETLSREQNDIRTQYKLILKEREILQNEKLEWAKDKEGTLNKLSETLISKGGEITETKVTKVTENLLKQFERVINKVSSFEDDGKRRDDTIDKAIKALLHPGGAGLSSETTLENVLKASGLRQKLNKDDEGDFILQSTLGSSQNHDMQRPDAIIYLPNNNYVVIDSKSSSHFLDLQDAIENGDKEKENQLMSKIKDRMNKHLNDLKSRDYQKAQLEYADIKEKNSIPPTVMTIMFLQTDKMLDVIRKADKDFEIKAYSANIPVTTPIGLKNLLNLSKYTIVKEKQNKNIDKLKDETKKLIDNIVNMFESANKIGKKLKESVDSYDNFANTFNKKIVTRTKNLKKLGIETKSDNIKKLETYEVTTNILEGEVEYSEESDNIDGAEKNNLIEE